MSVKGFKLGHSKLILFLRLSLPITTLKEHKNPYSNSKVLGLGKLVRITVELGQSLELVWGWQVRDQLFKNIVRQNRSVTLQDELLNGL